MVFTEATGKNVVINSWEEYARFTQEKETTSWLRKKNGIWS